MGQAVKMRCTRMHTSMSTLPLLARARCVGILALLITTVVQISVMVVLDIVPVSEEWNERQRDVLEEDERRLIEGPHPTSGEEAAAQPPAEVGKGGKAGANAGQAQKAAAEDDAAAETAAVAAAAVAAM